MTGPSPWQRWVHLIARREPGTTLALLRIALATISLGVLADVTWGGVGDDVWRLVWSGVSTGGYRDLPAPHLFRCLGGADPARVQGVMGISALAGVCALVGLGGRWPVLVLQQGLYALFSLNAQAGGGHDRLLVGVLWVLFLADSTQTLSVDARLRTGRWSDSTPVLAFPRWLVTFQLLVMYGSTGAQKLSADWWPAGRLSAVWYVLHTPVWARWLDVDWPFALTQFATVATLVFELGAPLMGFWLLARELRPGSWVASPRLRTAFVACGLALHGTLWVLLELGPFSPVTLAMYLALFHPDEWRLPALPSPPSPNPRPALANSSTQLSPRPPPAAPRTLLPRRPALPGS